MTAHLLLILGLLVFSYTTAYNSKIPSFNSLVKSKSKLQSFDGIDSIQIIDTSFNLAAGNLVIGTTFGLLENLKNKAAKVFGAGAIVFTVIGLFFGYQTASLRLTFDSDSFSVVKSDTLVAGTNPVVGGSNSWKYDSIVDYDFLPSQNFPILLYFKETQTPKENWVEIPITIDKAEGQQHFLPSIASVDQLVKSFESHGIKKVH